MGRYDGLPRDHVVRWRDKLSGHVGTSDPVAREQGEGLAEVYRTLGHTEIEVVKIEPTKGGKARR